MSALDESTFEGTPDNTYWVTKDERHILIKDLEDVHLINILKFLRKKAEAKRLDVAKFYLFGPQPHGEMAQAAHGRECDQLSEHTWRDYTYRHFDLLEGEAQFRKLKWNDMTKEQEEEWALTHDLVLLMKMEMR